MLHQSKEKIREGARKGRAKQARMAKQSRRVAVLRVLKDAEGGSRTVAQIAEASGRSPAVVRDAIKEMDRVAEVPRHERGPVPEFYLKERADAQAS